MSTITPAQALIDKLSVQHAWYFTGYIVFLLLSAVFTWLLWRSGNRVQDAIRQDAIARINEAQLGIEQAKQSATEAHERTAILETRAEELRQQNIQLARDMRDKDRQIAEANKSAAEANAQALKAQLELERFKAPRSLTNEEITKISEKIKLFAGQEFGVVTYWDMKEPFDFANRIYEALELAQWKYIPPKTATFMLGGTEGVQVWIHPDADENVKKAADALLSALSGIQVAVILKQQNPQNPRRLACFYS